MLQGSDARMHQRRDLFKDKDLFSGTWIKLKIIPQSELECGARVCLHGLCYKACFLVYNFDSGTHRSVFPTVASLSRRINTRISLESSIRAASTPYPQNDRSNSSCPNSRYESAAGSWLSSIKVKSCSRRYKVSRFVSRTAEAGIAGNSKSRGNIAGGPYMWRAALQSWFEYELQSINKGKLIRTD